MRTRILTIAAGVIAFGCVAARPAFAQGAGQDTVRGDLAVSYSVLHDSAQTYPAGIVLALGADVNKVLRIVAEFGTNSKTVGDGLGTNVNFQVLTYQGGVRFATSGKAKLRPFVQILAGGARSTGTLLGSGLKSSNNAVAVQPGGGVDFRVAEHFDGRIQVDYRAIRDGGATFNEYRVAFGIVIPFGR